MALAQRPTIALFTGDPAGIGPELVGKLLHDAAVTESADIVLIGQRDRPLTAAPVRWHDWSGLEAGAFKPGSASADNGRFMVEGLTQGVDLVRGGKADAFCFAPLNKGALRLGGMHQEDELRWFSDHLQYLSLIHI